MNKKLLIPALLITTLAGVGSVSSGKSDVLKGLQSTAAHTYQWMADSATSLFLPTNAQQDLISQIQQRLEEMKAELIRLIDEKDQLVKSTIIRAGCFVLTINPDDVYTGSSFFGIPYRCPDPETQSILLTSLMAVNLQFNEYNGRINQLREQINAVEGELAILIASQTTSSATGATTDGTSDTGSESSDAASETSDTGADSAPSADLALLNQFLLTPNPELETSVEEGYFQEVQLHGSAVPQVQLDGPNGPVSANFQDGVITLAEEVVLEPGKSLNLPQMGISISNQEEPKKTSQNFIDRLISKAFANNSSSDDSIVFPDLYFESLFSDPYGKNPFEVFINPTKSEIAVVADEFFFQVSYKVDSLSNVTLYQVEGNGVYESLKNEWVTLHGSATTGIVSGSFFDTATNGLKKAECTVNAQFNSTNVLSSTTVVNSCVETCINETVKVCLQCVPELLPEACSPPTDKVKFCEEACSKESIINEVEKVIVLC